MTDFEEILIPEKYRSEKSGNTVEDEIAPLVKFPICATSDNTIIDTFDPEK